MSYADWNLVLGVFVGITALVFAVLGVFLVRRIVHEDRMRRRLDDRLEAQARDTSRLADRFLAAPFDRLTVLADTLRRADVLVGDVGTGHLGRRDGRRRTYVEAEQGFSPFDPPGRIQAELRDGKSLEVRPADPRTVADAKREYAVSLRIVHDLYKGAYHVARRNEAVVEDIDALHRRIHVLKRSLIGGAVALAALVALPLGLVIAVPTRPIHFYLVDMTITIFTARMLLLALFVSGTVLTTWMMHRALARVDLAGLRYNLVRDHRDPRAFHPALRHQDQRRAARLRAAAGRRGTAAAPPAAPAPRDRPAGGPASGWPTATPEVPSGGPRGGTPT